MENEISAAITELTGAVQARASALEGRTQELGSRIHDLERRASRDGADYDSTPASWGSTVTASAQYRGFVGGGLRGVAAIPVHGALTTAPDSAGGLIQPDRVEGVSGPRRRLTVRALLGPGRTGTSTIEFFEESAFVNAAAPVAEGALKPESSIAYNLKQVPVRTIAHWIPASRQAIEDAPQLESLVNSALRYGLALVEEAQLLYGDGLGQNLSGLVPAATAYDATRTAANDTALDVIRHAISQAEEADLPASGIVLNTRDWMRMLGLKDAGGQYLSSGPFATADVPRLWGLPVVYTNALAVGNFLTGAFESAAQIFDRMDPEVLISSEDRDNFVRNQITVRAEERLALAVKRPTALIYGALPA